jgi:lysylphosphatidylglycerol synthetase-like protein (DUF2156 family)
MSKLSKDEKRSIAMAVVVGITGYLVSMFTCEDVFPRFGAVIVCVGVFFATRGFTLRLDAFEPVAEEMKRKSIDDGLHLLESRRGEISDEQVDESKSEFLRKAKRIDNEARRKMYRLKLRLLRVESSIVIAGTLIWAFGDWMVYGGYLSCTQ